MGQSKQSRRGRRNGTTTGSVVEPLEGRSLFSVAVQFDYSLDTNGFFNDADRRTVLQAAANALTNRLTDTLDAITPTGTNTWSIVGTHPSTGAMFNVANKSVAANTVVVYVGGYDIAGSTLGLGGPTGWSASGTSGWLSAIRTRGEAGAGTTPRTDFAPAAGSIAFDSATPWFFGTTTAGLTGSNFDFYSVATHELGHVLGVGTSDPWEKLASGGTFQGAKSKAVYGGAVPLDPSRSHLSDGVTVTGSTESALDPTIAKGVRKSFNALDYAALDDIGWDVAPPTVTVAARPATVRVNATASAITLADGRVFAAASGFTGGTSSTTAFAVAKSTEDKLYYTYRSGKDFSYARTLVNGTYLVRLSLTEPTQAATGKRTFDVFAEGATVITDLDVFKTAGAKTALTKDVTVTVTDGQLNLRFLGKVGDAIVSAVTIAPRFEAELATRSGASVASNNAGFTGSGFGDYNGAAGEFIQFSAGANAAGKHRLVFRYANGSTTARSLSLQVNGVTINAKLAFAPTGAWTTWKTVELIVNFVAGTNTVKLTSLNASAPNIDSLVVT